MRKYTFRGTIGRLLMRLFGLLPLENVAVFSAFDGKMYGDNPKAIYDEMLRRNLPLRYVWLLNDRSLSVTGAKVVKANSITALYYLSISRLWIDCSRKREWVIKRQGQFYIQTWHGDLCLKKIERDAADALPNSYINAAKHDSDITDLMLSGSTFRTNLYKTSFWYDGEILEAGTPKSDALYADKAGVRTHVREFFNLPQSYRIALYLPTFRSDSSLSSYLTGYDKVLQSLESSTNAKWCILVRLHPKISDLQNEITYSEHVVNSTSYPVTNELIAASDLVITDYSSCMFDAMEAKVPVILYAADVEQYLGDRGFYFDLFELPFPLTENVDSLCDIIGSFEYEAYSTSVESFMSRQGLINDGKSSARVVDEILKRIGIGKR